MGWTSKATSLPPLLEMTDQQIWSVFQSETISYYDVAIAHLHRARTEHDNHEVYALMQNRQSGEKFIMLMLIDRWQVQGEENVGWKEISESNGPAYSNCSAELFKWVDPPNEYARNWRRLCERKKIKLNRIDNAE